MIPDPWRRTIKIDIRFQYGSVVRFDGRRLPKICEGIIGELTIPAYAIEDEGTYKELAKEFEQSFLQAGEIVNLGLSCPWGTPKPEDLLQPQKGCFDYRYRYAPVELLEDLLIYRTGDKSPRLRQCKCRIPVLDDKEACSLNHAFTLLSERFETKRRSHTGNVFDRGYVERNDRWIQLNNLRRNLPPAAAPS